MIISKKKFNKIIDDLQSQLSAKDENLNLMTMQYQKLLSDYGPVISLSEQIEKKQRDLSDFEQDSTSKMEELSAKYDEAFQLYSKLKLSVDLYSEKSEFLDYGVYEPVYNFDTEEEFKKKIEENQEKQKLSIKEKTAVICDTQWRVQDDRGYWSTAKGTAMINREVKLALRSFNGECDAIIAKVKWNNYEQSKKKINDIFERLNKIQDFHKTHISEAYLNLKQEELSLTYEKELLKYKKKEEERERREELREEQKAIRELERERERAESEELHYQAALEKVKQEIEKATGIQYEKLSEKMRAYEEALAEAKANKERAISMAQQTKAGYVYIISNIGSFGEGIYKIGMTRRLDPEDRIRELSNASVPFKFDIHAMIYSEDAPALETLLHNTFETNKVNKVNGRKEFFNVSLEEIEDKIRESGIDASFVKVPEARDYREGLMQAMSGNSTTMREPVIEFPEKING